MQAHDLALRFALSKPEGYIPVFLPSMTTVGGKNGKSDTETVSNRDSKKRNLKQGLQDTISDENH